MQFATVFACVSYLPASLRASVRGREVVRAHTSASDVRVVNYSFCVNVVFQVAELVMVDSGCESARTQDAAFITLHAGFNHKWSVPRGSVTCASLMHHYKCDRRANPPLQTNCV